MTTQTPQPINVHFLRFLSLEKTKANKTPISPSNKPNKKPPTLNPVLSPLPSFFNCFCSFF